MLNHPFPVQLIPCGLLLACVLSYWLAKRATLPLLALTILAGLVTHSIAPLGVGLVAVMALCLWQAQRPSDDGLRGGTANPPYAGCHQIHQLPWIVGSVLLALLLGAWHPGFERVLLISQIKLSAVSVPFDISLNMAKTLSGILLLHFLLPRDQQPAMDVARHGPRWIIVFALTLISVIGLSWLLDYTRFDPKWHHAFLLWAPVNFLTTVMSEEAFFRGVLQRQIDKRLGSLPHGGLLAILISALLFGLAHLAGGWQYVLLASVAGLSYGYVYKATGRIEYSMALHVSINAIHFLLFAYPRLA